MSTRRSSSARSQSRASSSAAVKKEEQLLDDPTEWFKANIGTEMWRFIVSYPDMDHLSGIRRLLDRSSGINLTVGWAYDHTRFRLRNIEILGPAST
jgi:hypothetical protein